MRPKRNRQDEFDFDPSNLRVTNDYFRRYDAVSRLLDGNPEILGLVHRDVAKAIAAERRRDRAFRFTSETVLRMCLCQALENASQRGIVVRVDDSPRLRRFTRIFNGPMMDFSTYCNLKNRIRPATWRRINRLLAKSAVTAAEVSGERLRLDTTAVETNIHYPSDSSLLWDTYRVLARLLRKAREVDPGAVGDRRLQDRVVRRHQTWISRKAGRMHAGSAALKERYTAIFGLVEAILRWSGEVAAALRRGRKARAYDPMGEALAAVIAEDLEHYSGLGERVLDQARRRILLGEVVPAKEKLYSIFEPHTELLKRGKAGKPIEFGHMIFLQQVEGGLVTDYEVFLRRPREPELLAKAVARHEKVFGEPPRELSADKGFWGGEEYRPIAEAIDVVSIGKQGRRTAAETRRETSPAFQAAQRFRAGIEGTISFLKRGLGLSRCLAKGWKHFAATVGTAIFAHNLWVLARGAG
jgi:IS5 family transposase